MDQGRTTVFLRTRLWAGIASFARPVFFLLRVAGDALAAVAWLTPAVFFSLAGYLFFHAAVDSPAIAVRAPVVDGMLKPSWFSGEDIAGIEARVAGIRGRPLYSPSVAADLASALKGDPWVASVSYVRRRYPASLDCEILVRRPFAAVEAGRRFFIVDRSGVRLPLPPLDSADGRLPILVGVRSFPPGPGGSWQDPALVAALLVLSRTSDLPAFTGVDGFSVLGAEVASDNGVAVVTLHTAPGTSLVWGPVYRPGCEPFNIPPVPQRLAAIRDVVSSIGADRLEMVDVSVLPPVYRLRQ
ncbi:MAG: hypothetical protein JW909_00120 [Planctomycetes bacterium]|nr:hypothetical protein [Planctomycetota bacterium]